MELHGVICADIQVYVPQRLLVESLKAGGLASDQVFQ